MSEEPAGTAITVIALVAGGLAGARLWQRHWARRGERYEQRRQDAARERIRRNHEQFVARGRELHDPDWDDQPPVLIYDQDRTHNTLAAWADHIYNGKGGTP